MLVLTVRSFWKKYWALGYNSTKFRNFPVISYRRLATREATLIYHGNCWFGHIYCRNPL